MKKHLKGTLELLGKNAILISISLILSAIFLFVTGYTPFAVIQGIFQGMTKDIAGTVRWATPLILAGLAIAVSYKAQVFNLGVDGQIYMGASFATFVALLIPEGVPSFLAIGIVFLAGMLAGALYALIPAILKVVFDTNEVISTLLLNFVAVLFTDYLVANPLRDTLTTTQLNASRLIPSNTVLPRIKLLAPSSANVGFYIAIALALIIGFIFYKTTFGYEIKLVGSNSHFAKYSGIKDSWVIIKVMLLSGAIAGMIGVIEVTAIQHRLLANFNPDFGFDGIVVSLLSNNNPTGVIFSGFFFGALKNGGINMERITDVPSAVTEIVMSIIIITIAAKIVIPNVKSILNKFKKNKNEIVEVK